MRNYHLYRAKKTAKKLAVSHIERKKIVANSYRLAACLNWKFSKCGLWGKFELVRIFRDRTGPHLLEMFYLNCEL